jgi:DNA-binding CsgD family transcriptional regulator
MSASLMLKHVSKADLVGAMDLIDASLGVQTDEQFLDLLRRLFTLLPLTGADVGVAELDDANAIVRNHRRISIDYPTAWVDEYRRRGFRDIDPVINNLFTQERPLIWSKLRGRNRSAVHRRFYGCAAEFGLRDGFAFGARLGKASSASFFSCIGGDIAEHKRHQLLLNYIVPHLHVAFSRVVSEPPADRPRLTPRELEVLRWVTLGKSNWEISILLSVSARAVKFHVENAMRKLNVANRAQAVAVALSIGLIPHD